MSAEPKESPEAFEAWVMYRDMGTDRSLRAVGEALGKSEGLMERWSSRHHWVARAAAFDRDTAAKAEAAAQARIIAERTKRREQRLSTAAVLRGKSVRALARMPNRYLATRPAAVVQMLRHADQTERLDLGEATARLEQSGPGGGPISMQGQFEVAPQALDAAGMDEMRQQLQDLVDAVIRIAPPPPLMEMLELDADEPTG